MSASLVATVEVVSDPSSEPARLPYEPPRILASASLAQVTLFSGGAADGGVIFGD